MRSGTENVPGIAGFGAACQVGAAQARERIRRMNGLKERCLQGLSSFSRVQVTGGHQAPHILSLAVPGARSEHLIRALERRGICVSAGSACAKGHRSHVLEAMALPPEVIDGSIRVSLGFDTTEADVDGFLTGLEEALAELL